MDSLSKVILTIYQPFSILFSKPSWKKATILLLGTILCIGKRTVCSALHAMCLEHQTSFSKYHHLLNRVACSSLKAAKILFYMLIALIPDKNPLVIFVDETLEHRKGKKIKAKGYYRLLFDHHSQRLSKLWE
jgi:DDE superfamily endonuclease